MTNTPLIQARALLARQQLLQQQQNKRLARRIHDDICQHMTLLTLQLSMSSSHSTPPANWAQSCKDWSALVMNLGQNLRSIMNELQPRIVDEMGLGAALQRFACSSPHGINCDLLLPAEPVNLPPTAANEVFAICRDLFSELLAPNGITDAIIELEQSGEVLRLQVRPSDPNSTLAPLVAAALDSLSIHERLFCMDGTVETQEDPEKGLTISLSMPANFEMAPQPA
jgi:two-component system sensor histidine kinase UhpB